MLNIVLVPKTGMETANTIFARWRRKKTLICDTAAGTDSNDRCCLSQACLREVESLRPGVRGNRNKQRGQRAMKEEVIVFY